MATLEIWEVYASGMNRQQVAMLPGGTVQKVTITTTGGASAALNAATIGVRLKPLDAGMYVRCTSTGTVASSTNGISISSGEAEYFGVPPSGGYIITAITTA